MSTTWHDSRFGPGSYEYSAQEDRSTPRHAISSPVRLRASGTDTHDAELLEVGIAGFTATAPVAMQTGAFCWLTVGEMPAIKGEVIWCRNGLMGGAFSSLLSEDMLATILASNRGGATPQF